MKKLKQKSVGSGESYECTCPYCGADQGIINDPAYYYERETSPECDECGETFEVEDKLRSKPKNKTKKKKKTK